MYKEIEANIWDYEDDVKVITTNGNIRKDGKAVMGRGLALQASKNFPMLSTYLGEYIFLHKNESDKGNRCYYFPNMKIITFPTKKNFWENSDYDLIKKSMKELYNICIDYNIKRIIFPHVGCNNGGLTWENVKPKIEEFLNCKEIEFIIVYDKNIYINNNILCSQVI